MKIRCQRCHKTNQGRYKTFNLQIGEGKYETVTWCYPCLDAPLGSKKADKEMFDHFATPFWKLMGLPAKPDEIKFEKYLKWRGMSYGDYKREKDAILAKNSSALPDFEAHLKKYGTKSAPDPTFDKDGNRTS